MEAENLLRALDDRVRGDRGPAGLQGTIAFGIRDPKGVSIWWSARFDGGVETKLGTEMPAFDAAYGLGEDAALALLEGRPLPKDAVCIQTGDAALLAQFVSRYLRDKNQVAMRAAVRRDAARTKRKKQRP